LRKIAVFAALLAVGGCATAYALTAEVGSVWVSATATVHPRELPARGNAPVFLIDRNGRVDTRGLPVCTLAKLEGTTPTEARKRCAGALVGKGKGRALVTMPGRAPFVITSPLSLFNGPPSGGLPTLIAHAYETVPVPKTLLVPIEIERVATGRYGFRVDVQMPEVASGFGAPILAEATIGAVRKRSGRKVGYISAHCVGGRLQVSGKAIFTNGDSFPATLTSPCHFPR
jgi:hypothetical protein